MLNPRHARLAPHLLQSSKGPAAAVFADAGAQKASHPEPRPATEGTRSRRQHYPRIELPEGSPQRLVRHVEIQACESAAGAQHPDELSDRQCRVPDVPEEVGEADRVERRVSERQFLGTPLAER